MNESRYLCDLKNKTTNELHYYFCYGPDRFRISRATAVCICGEANIEDHERLLSEGFVMPCAMAKEGLEGIVEIFGG